MAVRLLTQMSLIDDGEVWRPDSVASQSNRLVPRVEQQYQDISFCPSRHQNYLFRYRARADRKFD